MESHTIGAHSGQFMCQRGCNIWYNNVRDLDKHIKTHHREPEPVIYNCDQCDSSFGAQFQLRQHIATGHNKKTEAQVKCEHCGEISKAKSCSHHT